MNRADLIQHLQVLHSEAKKSDAERAHQKELATELVNPVYWRPFSILKWIFIPIVVVFAASMIQAEYYVYGLERDVMMLVGAAMVIRVMMFIWDFFSNRPNSPRSLLAADHNRQVNQQIAQSKARERQFWNSYSAQGYDQIYPYKYCTTYSLGKCIDYIHNLRANSAQEAINLLLAEKSARQINDNIRVMRQENELRFRNAQNAAVIDGMLTRWAINDLKR